MEGRGGRPVLLGTGCGGQQGHILDHEEPTRWTGLGGAILVIDS